MKHLHTTVTATAIAALVGCGSPCDHSSFAWLNLYSQEQKSNCHECGNPNGCDEDGPATPDLRCIDHGFYLICIDRAADDAVLGANGKTLLQAVKDDWMMFEPIVEIPGEDCSSAVIPAGGSDTGDDIPIPGIAATYDWRWSWGGQIATVYICNSPHLQETGKFLAGDIQTPFYRAGQGPALAVSESSVHLGNGSEPVVDRKLPMYWIDEAMTVTAPLTVNPTLCHFGMQCRSLEHLCNCYCESDSDCAAGFCEGGLCGYAGENFDYSPHAIQGP